MPPSDATISPAMPPLARHRVLLSGWGGGARVPADVVRVGSVEQLRAAVVGAACIAGSIARGMGRSYGDAAQRLDGLVLDTTPMRRFEREGGVLTAGAGCTLKQLLTALEPAGWILPVVPGTQYVTVGGAIATDIHGKNHATAGTFANHVLSLGLLTAAGEELEVSPDRDPELFAATVGGMGLTGVILWARIALTPFGGAAVSVDSERVQTLDEALDGLLAAGGSHRVAWLDLLGSLPVRGIVTRADLVDQPVRADAAGSTVPARAAVPEWWPGGILRRSTVRAYNEYRFRRAPRRESGRVEPFGVHMFPLDGLDRWPRLYGRRGVVQYQLVLPRGRESDLELLLLMLRRSRVPCYLAVLKDFGRATDAPLSFPLAGWTLALDLPRAAPGVESLLTRFDAVVAGAGGRVYLAKDGRLRPDALAAMYPRLAQWRAVRDRVDPERRWCSDLAVRTGLVGRER
jgi:decaprenylphospho-beta-D-ribofuranose 2-oxidase